MEEISLDCLKPGVTQAKLILSHGTCVSYFSSYCKESTEQEKLRKHGRVYFGSHCGYTLACWERMVAGSLGSW